MSQRARLFGPAELLVGAHWVPLPLDKRGALLAVLARTAVPVRRTVLARLFWDGASPDRGRTNLRGLLARVQTSGMALHLDVTRDSVAWHVETDVAAFLSALGRGDWSEAAEHNRAPFLDGMELGDAPEFSSWLELERRGFEHSRRRAVVMAAEELARAGDVGRAVTLLRDSRRLDMLDEDLMQTCLRLAQGDLRVAQDALREFDSFTSLLSDELGLDPQPHTAALAHELRTLGGGDTAFASTKASLTAERMSNGRLPHPVAPMIRREAEVVELAELLTEPTTRWVTLTGPGGIGKTSLALQTAHGAHVRFADGAHWFPIAGLRDAGDLPVAIARGIGMPIAGVADIEGRLLNRLANKEALLVLDDLDGLPLAGAWITTLLNTCPAVRVLATSRSPLKSEAETTYRVSGLSYPDTATGTLVEGYEAVRLFVLRARQSRGDYRLSDDDSGHIVEICRLVDGSPLGIELAAGRTVNGSVGEVLRLLRRDLGALVSDLRNQADRHRSLRASFDHAWRDLSPRERRAAAALSVFQGPFAAEVAVHVAEVKREALLILLDRSFLKRDESGRLTFHAVVKQFAGDELAKDTAFELEVRDRHARFFAREVERHGRWLRGGTKQPAAVDELATHLNDIQAAWQHARKTSEEDLLAKFMPLLHVYEIRGLYEQGEREFRATADAIPNRSAVKAQALTASAVMAGRASRLHESRMAAEESLAIWRELGEEDALTYLHVGVLRWLEDDREGAESEWSRAVATAELRRDEWCRLAALGNLGVLALNAGDQARAEELLTKTQRGCAALHDDWGSSFAELNLGFLALERGELRVASKRLGSALAVARRVGQVRTVMDALDALVQVAEADGRRDDVARLREEIRETAEHYGLPADY